MNRVLISSAMVFAVVVGMLLNMQVLSADDQASVSKGGAPCALFGADESGGPLLDDEVLGEITLVVENDNKVMMKCKGKGITNLSGSDQTFEGFACGIVTAGGDVVDASESQASVSVDGVASLSCTYHK